jgi:hypothetical protein
MSVGRVQITVLGFLNEELEIAKDVFRVFETTKSSAFFKYSFERLSAEFFLWHGFYGKEEVKNFVVVQSITLKTLFFFFERGFVMLAREFHDGKGHGLVAQSGQSTGLLIQVSRVQIPSGPLVPLVTPRSLHFVYRPKGHWQRKMSTSIVALRLPIEVHWF